MSHLRLSLITWSLLLALSLFSISVVQSESAVDDQTTHELSRAKRGWNGAKGMWGKRASDLADDNTEDELDAMDKRGWNKASGMWGKRSASDFAAEDPSTMFMMEAEKRGWNKASGMWGKRAGWNGAKGMWGKRKRSVV